MPATTLFFRLLADDDKAATLADAVAAVAAARPAPAVFAVDPASLRAIPGTPFAYWASERIMDLFNELPRLGADQRSIEHGTSTKNDKRFLRLIWEAPPAHPWTPFAKGGEYSPYYAPIRLAINWGANGREIEAFLIQRYPYLNGDANWVLHRECSYFRPGLTWPRRTTSGISVRVMPEGCIFADKGPAAFAQPAELPTLMALMNSRPFGGLIALQLGAAEDAARSYEVGIIQRTPVPDLRGPDAERLGALTLEAVDVARVPDQAVETSHLFHTPALLQDGSPTLAARARNWQDRMAAGRARLADIQREIDEIACRLYGLDEEDRRSLEIALRPAGPAPDAPPRRAGATDTEVDDADEDGGAEEELAPTDARGLVAGLISYLAGCAFGRWDIRSAGASAPPKHGAPTGERQPPALPDPWAPLPVCSPGMLTGDDGLPAREAPSGYPLRVSWDGILVEDAGPDGERPHARDFAPQNAEDIVRRVREALALLWPDTSAGAGAQLQHGSDAIEQEACEILGVPSLRDYFRKPSGFFADHLKRYSKSRRQAPLYWPLSTASGSYTLWLYYHRLDADLLYRAVNGFVNPKIDETEDRIARMQERLAAASGAEATRLRAGLEDARKLLAELQDFKAELLRVAGLPYRPDLNDGVLITACPLWRLFRLPRWRKDLEAGWKKLEAGDYDWARLALALWPDRVRAACRRDRSIAIAHGLEHLCEAPAPKAGGKRRRAEEATADGEE